MTIELTLLVGILGVIISYQTYQINKNKSKHRETVDTKKEVKDDAKNDAKVEAQLDYISRGVDDIRIDLKANERQIVALGERITRVEESNKQAHKRLDKLGGE